MSDTRPVSARPEHVDQGDLFDGELVGRGSPGRTEGWVRGAIAVAEEQGLLGELDKGLAGLAVELAAACDMGRRRHDPYAVAAAGRELREVLSRLKLDPTARVTGQGDAFAELIEKLGAT